MRSGPLTTAAAAVDFLARQSLSGGRYQHSRRVASLAAELCARHGLDPEGGYLAGLGHDVSRELPGQEILGLAGQDGEEISPLEKLYPVLVHGRASAVLLSTSAGISFTDVLQAVRDHVCGRPAMGALSRILFAADFLEEGRDFHQEGARRRMLALPLDATVLAVVERKIHYVRAAGEPVQPASLALYEELRGNAG